MGKIASLRQKVSRLVAGGDKLGDDVEIISGSGMFDADAYLKRYPDVAASGMGAIEHYVLHGADEGRNPGSVFDTEFYKRENPDVASSGMNPFRHYIEFGRGEGRAPTPTPVAGTAPAQPAGRDLEGGEDDPSAFRQFFDRDYYLQHNPDVARSRLDPYAHFCRYGWKELRSPNAGFDIGWYWGAHMLPTRVQGNPLGHYARTGKPGGLAVRPTGVLSEADKQVLARVCEAALEDADPDVDDFDRIGRLLARCGRWASAEIAARNAVALRWSDAGRHIRLADVLYRQSKWWQVAESLRVATELDGRHGDWFFRLGDAHEKTYRLQEAADAYRRASELDKDSVQANYRLGYAYEKLGRADAAAAAYRAALSLDPRPECARYGIGVLHQERGYWEDAAAAYAQELLMHPFDADLNYRHGMALDRCYRWAEALAAYARAISCDPRRHYWHYRMGFVLERLQRWTEAAEAYSAAIALSPGSGPLSYWRYRQGYVLDQAGCHEQACLAYLQTVDAQALEGARPHPRPEIETGSPPATEPDPAGEADDALEAYLARFDAGEMASEILSRDRTQADSYYFKGEMHERSGAMDEAAAAYREALLRQDAHTPSWYYRLGLVLHAQARHREACEAFREMRILRRPFGVDMSKHQQTPSQKERMEYNEYLAVLPVAERVILYESYGGSTIGGNPYAIFMRLLGEPEFGGWRHVWAVKDRNAVPQELRRHPDVILVTRGSDLYRRYLATASHLINDVTFPDWFLRREEQKYLNTWHGTPLKCLGKDIPGEFMAHRNTARNFLQATHVLSPNPHTSRAMTECQGILGIGGASLAETGYPRVDRVIDADDATRTRVRERLGLDASRPMVLYAPTWRGHHGSAEIHEDRLIADLRRLAGCGGQIVFRGHQMVETLLAELDLPVTIAPQEIDTSDILAVTDILITDYSSICFDFLPRKLPILYYVYDLAEYQASRGLYFDIGEMPGEACADLDALMAALARQLRRPSCDEAGYRRALETFCPREDGHAAERAIRFFFFDADECVVGDGRDSGRKSVLFFAGLFPSNGINSSFLNLADRLDREDRLRISVAIDPGRVASDPQRVENLARLPGSVGVLARTGSMLFSPEESWINSVFSARRNLMTQEMWDILGAAYRREYRRMFGDARFDVVVNFEGYSLFWTTVLAFAPEGTLNAVYLHSDMMSECKLRHPYLQGMMRLYPHYDAIVSVSERMNEVNRDSLSMLFGTDPARHVWCPNMIDCEHIRRMAAEPLDEDIARWIDGRRAFVALGRLSPEKDYAKLIKAFASVRDAHPDACLLILGDGPLRNDLQIRIAEAGLDGQVMLAGLRGNPFPALSRCDCLVLSSNHEGQPMVLLEAMVLDKPIIATDIDGSRAVLKEGHGHLAENSAAGLSAAMLAFLRDGLQRKPFDAESYEARALACFHTVVAGGRRSDVVAGRDARFAGSGYSDYRILPASGDPS